jgi:hypothetical protein
MTAISGRQKNRMRGIRGSKPIPRLTKRDVPLTVCKPISYFLSKIGGATEHHAPIRAVLDLASQFLGGPSAEQVERVPARDLMVALDGEAPRTRLDAREHRAQDGEPLLGGQTTRRAGELLERVL